ncbi:MAG TPA: saccharopine dehydrogenase NADP-binding domain-containing protein [bacterium]|nr:saccharopine dehydrogenase NADP-binding domain-containing protein [bacterium]
MKIIVLGGAGEMGSRAAEDLAAAPDVSQVTIADRNVAAAEKIAATLRGKNAEVDACAVDALDHAALVAALRGYDVAAGALGPFYLFEERLVAAATEAGVNYCSICDEWKPAEAVIDRFDAIARDKGLTHVICLGASPGLTNMGVKLLAARMETVKKVAVGVYLPLDCGAQGAALRHGLYVMSGDTIVWRGGKRTTIKACTEKRAFELPRFGTIDLWNMGHAEPATVPRYYPDVESVDFYMGYGTGTGLIAALGRWGAFNGERRAKFFAAATEWVDRLVTGPQAGWGATRIDVWGVSDGKEEHRLLCGVGEMRQTTGLSLAAGAYLLGKGQLTAGAGVFAPEGCLDPHAFFRYLHERGVDAYRDTAMESPLF